jgi:hypothetical protein
MTKVHPDKIILHPPHITIQLGSIYDESHISLSVKFSFCFYRYKKLCSCLLVIIIITIIILSIILTKKQTNDNPCIYYTKNDYASSISLECLRYLWNKYHCNGYISDNYYGWWRRSPEGGQMVPCIYPKTQNLCGAGSYNTIIVYFNKCNLNYQGIN